MFNLENKTILITGASSGIGRGVAIECANQGANVIITGRDHDRLAETAASLLTTGTQIISDLTNEEDITQLINTLPQVHGVVFCAGVSDYLPVKLINSNKIDTIFTVNFKSQVILTQQLIKHKKIVSGGSLVYISSIASKLGVAGTSLYAASKAALNGFMKVTASELSKQKIRVNSVCPGIVMTPMGEKAVDASSDIAKEYPLGLGEVADVAGPCIFLLSDTSKWITGTELILDGGLTLK